ncbi:MAG: undecaprenyldiphospho-muramoylpentapeptide beta-N-acetylglucosaminyltransferase [Myxococcota bacterium]|jgi:UDP-N-acetylglucosamine--N-acetylmuramyl-(pentapeptide) pyrophosphoryl-undecaprenol N-acetylglucosamine transferase|nr:undecaprenyldiphospho-muramoylpentapeptide beta-N-acetylglucosaminyltransferase [Myxococcota bacterium]
MNDSSLSAVIAGGGTGGHVFPALAIGEEIARRGGSARFVGTEDRLEARLVPRSGFGIEFVRVKPLKGGGLGRAAGGLLAVPAAVLSSMMILRRLRPNVVVGVGGYVAGPVVLAAYMLRIPTALHEQNASVGLTNKMLSHLVSRAFVTYDSTLDEFPPRRAIVTGNPVRHSIVEAASATKKREKGLLRILVMGGSQGALAIDERVPLALAGMDLGPLQVRHQCTAAKVESVTQAYSAAGIPAQVMPFIDDAAEAMSWADLFIGRSGATTLAEIAAMGLPSVLLPYPHHTDKQQERNAAPFVAARAAMVLDEKTTGVKELADAVRQIAGDPQRWSAAAGAAKALGRPQAAESIVDELSRIARKCR